MRKIKRKESSFSRAVPTLCKYLKSETSAYILEAIAAALIEDE
ncbi:MAG: hypothetical protein ACSNEK_06705 [Parachlamydiaceae bacterium]